MSQYDIVVIGAGRIGRKIAEEMHEQGKKVAIVSLNDDSATIFGRTLHSLNLKRAVGDPNPHGPDGVDTYRGRPEFSSDKKELSVGDQVLKSKDFVIATGAIPQIPAIQGLSETPYETPLSIFSKEDLPKKPLIIGGGPVAVALAFELQHKGVAPTVLCNKSTLLPKDEPEISERVFHLLTEHGAIVHLDAQTTQIRTNEKNQQSVVFQKNGSQTECQSDGLIMATGFEANSRGFGFEKIGVYINGHNQIIVNDQMQTSTAHVWAAGAVTGPPFNFALEEHQANLLINNINSPFFSQIRMEPEEYPVSFPLCPPLAKIGLSENQARIKFRDVKTLVTPLYDSYARDRSGKEIGLIKLIGRKKSGTILGAHILAPHAEEMILFLNLAKRAEVSYWDLLDRQHFPGPSIGEGLYYAIKKWADS